MSTLINKFLDNLPRIALGLSSYGLSEIPFRFAEQQKEREQADLSRIGNIATGREIPEFARPGGAEDIRDADYYKSIANQLFNYGTPQAAELGIQFLETPQSALKAQTSGTGLERVARSIMEANPEIDYITALSMAKSGLGQGRTYREGEIAPIGGALATEKEFAAAPERGKREVQIDTTAELERQKRLGTGEISPLEKQEKGQRNISRTLDYIGKAYNKLDELRAITSVGRSPAENLKISLSTSDIGQAAGSAVATPAQVQREIIKTSIPILMRDIKNATGMSAQEVNSIPEMQLLKDSLSNPKMPIETVKEVLKNLENAYGGEGNTPLNNTSGKTPAEKAADLLSESKTIGNKEYYKKDGKWFLRGGQ